MTLLPLSLLFAAYALAATVDPSPSPSPSQPGTPSPSTPSTSRPCPALAPHLTAPAFARSLSAAVDADGCEVLGALDGEVTIFAQDVDGLDAGALAEMIIAGTHPSSSWTPYASAPTLPLSTISTWTLASPENTTYVALPDATSAATVLTADAVITPDFVLHVVARRAILNGKIMAAGGGGGGGRGGGGGGGGGRGSSGSSSGSKSGSSGSKSGSSGSGSSGSKSGSGAGLGSAYRPPSGMTGAGVGGGAFVGSGGSRNAGVSLGAPGSSMGLVVVGAIIATLL